MKKVINAIFNKFFRTRKTEIKIGMLVKEKRTGVVGKVVEKNASHIYPIGIEWDNERGKIWNYRHEDIGKKIKILA